MCKICKIFGCFIKYAKSVKTIIVANLNINESSFPCIILYIEMVIIQINMTILIKEKKLLLMIFLILTKNIPAIATLAMPE
jgi:hypothetical protein